MNLSRRLLWPVIAFASTLLPAGLLPAQTLQFGEAEVKVGGRSAVPSSPSAFGFLLLHRGEAAQVALMGRSPAMLVSLREGQEVETTIPVSGLQGPVKIAAQAVAVGPSPAEVGLAVGEQPAWRTVSPERPAQLDVSTSPENGSITLRLRTRHGGMRLGDMPTRSVGMSPRQHGDASVAVPPDREAAVRWRELRVQVGNRWFDVPVTAAAGNPEQFPPPVLPLLHKAIEDALVEWDWHMQDGIGTERAPSTYAVAIQKTLDRGDQLIQDLQAGGVSLGDLAARWKGVRNRFREAKTVPDTFSAWEELWRDVHLLRREIALANPLAQTGPLVFAKQTPSLFSHQLTQYEGNCARPGGGIFVLDAPGRSMQCRQFAAGELPLGSYEFPEVSYDGTKVLFAYCHVDSVAPNRERHIDHFFHLYEIGADGSGLRQLTSGAFDDFAPRYLPDGNILFISSRRGGFHRCGQGPCPVHTLALAGPDGSNPHPISFHETHEWDPSVLGDGRVIYTRWDYVDRNAVFYQQLWTARPDGTDVRIFYGNNTFSPVGVWESRAVPGSHRVMATAGAHHAMTAGSIILLDTTKGIDGPEPITRLTPDALFPESEVPVAQRGPGTWSAPVGVPVPPKATPEAERWPGHCYRTPYPLSENYFLAAYSFDRLIGEPHANAANMFGIYLVDAFGNKELLYRDLNICSLWPVPLRARPVPPQLPSLLGTVPVFAAHKTSPAEPTPFTAKTGLSPLNGTSAAKKGLSPSAAQENEGTFFVQNVYQSWPPLPPGSVKRLRIVQVLPKSTWHANNPPLGLPSISPGKQVLGTVPVEPDGSAYFRAPAGIPVAFQALDELGQAVQVMRSLAYLQPGENASCVGCHEPRTTAPPLEREKGTGPICRNGPEGASHKLDLSPFPAALTREPSVIQPGPDGSNPLSYPILVQPVLDKRCVSCHSPQKPEGKVILTGQPQGHYTVSYNALARLVPYSDWGAKPGDFRKVNSEPTSAIDFFGARGSSLTRLLRNGHYDVKLSPDEWERLVTWMDANVLFYGTFDPADQARQRRGERIAGPKLQ